MKKEDIHLSDIGRILFGDTPPVFVLEVVLRTLFVYLFLLIAIRLLGKRTNGEITVTEVAIIVMLGAVVSVPMQMPDNGVLQGVLVLLCIVVFQRGITWLTIRSRRLEDITQGTLSIIVKDGILQKEVLRKARISTQQLFAIIRSKQVYNLGRVERLYMEACGTFSLYCTTDERPGLPIYPPGDAKMMETVTTHPDLWACCSCGTVLKTPGRHPCPACGMNEWVSATTD